jgi:pimeloyl-ACP methyl ester carboxylesterase
MLQRPFVRQRTTTSFGEWLRPFVMQDERSLARERARYREVRVPTLVLWGDADSVTPIAQGRDIAGLISAAELVVLSGVGHIPAIEAPERFEAELLRWLGRTR